MKTPLLNIRRTVASGLILAFFSTSLPIPQVHAGEVVIPLMPAPGTMVALSPDFTPAHLKGIVIHPDNALQFDFLIHTGDGHLSDVQKKEEYNKLIKYFLSSLTVPDEDQWVNLSPYEHNRIIKDSFGKTQMGRDLLGQDYLLKQIISSLMYPESGLGKSFWNKVYEKTYKELGDTNIPVNTFNKVWIIPDQAIIHENGNTAFIVKSHLKVMLEQDYLATQKNSQLAGPAPQLSVSSSRHPSPRGVAKQDSNVPLMLRSKQTNSGSPAIASQIIREIILPELEHEVNEGKNFAQLRQVYSGMLLAAWYKRALKETLLGKVFADKAKVKGVDQDPKNNEAIYQQYLQAFKKGVYSYIKEDADKYTNQTIPRKYFAGGLNGYKNFAQVVEIKHRPVTAGDIENLDAAMTDISTEKDKDAAMTAEDIAQGFLTQKDMTEEDLASKKIDILMILGNDSIDVLKKTLDLLNKGIGKKVLISGGVGRLTQPLKDMAAREGFNIQEGSEARLIQQILRALANRRANASDQWRALAERLSKDDAFILEEESRYTVENYIKIRQVLTERGDIKKDPQGKPLTVLTMQKALQQPRTKGNFNAVFKQEIAEGKIVNINFTADYVRDDKFPFEAVAELARNIMNYQKEDLVYDGGIESIPASVWTAGLRLWENLPKEQQEELAATLTTNMTNMQMTREGVYKDLEPEAFNFIKAVLGDAKNAAMMGRAISTIASAIGLQRMLPVSQRTDWEKMLAEVDILLADKNYAAAEERLARIDVLRHGIKADIRKKFDEDIKKCAEDVFVTVNKAITDNDFMHAGKLLWGLELNFKPIVTFEKKIIIMDNQRSFTENLQYYTRLYAQAFLGQAPILLKNNNLNSVKAGLSFLDKLGVELGKDVQYSVAATAQPYYLARIKEAEMAIAKGDPHEIYVKMHAVEADESEYDKTTTEAFKRLKGSFIETRIARVREHLKIHDRVKAEEEIEDIRSTYKDDFVFENWISLIVLDHRLLHGDDLRPEFDTFVNLLTKLGETSPGFNLSTASLHDAIGRERIRHALQGLKARIEKGQFDKNLIPLIDYVEQELKKIADQAMPGGIDMNSANMSMVIKRDGKGVPLPLSQQDMSSLSHIEGFVPHIIEIRPAIQLRIFNLPRGT